MTRSRFVCWLFLSMVNALLISSGLPLLVWGQDLTDAEWNLIRSAEQRRIAAIQKVQGSVVAIYDVGRQGGGSGVILDPSGIAITNHHVIMGAGIKGWAGLDDGKLYPWELVGTDPGGDVAVIQLTGRDSFPAAALGDSDRVQVGDWALAMGNPFVLTEDQSPTVTLGIVSGVKRFQEGAGQNQLVYGNCIQIDSSINPGNSGGPLFNLAAEVIGINGRGSFLDRGRVNVGLGYAISANQIKNFLPDLLATKLVEHGTLDANFSDQNGRVVCSTINELGPVAEAGLALGDTLLEFEGIPIASANQFTNLICTLPEDWPARLVIEASDGTRRQIDVRLLGLPYARPPQPPAPDQEPKPEEQPQRDLQKAMYELLAAEPGTIRLPELNRRYARHYLNKICQPLHQDPTENPAASNSRSNLVVLDSIERSNHQVGQCRTTLAARGAVQVQLHWTESDSETFLFDGERFAVQRAGVWRELTATEARQVPWLIQALASLNLNREPPFFQFGEALIDGSDKALGQPAFRFRCQDADADWFFFWLAFQDRQGRESYSLAKASADKDCDGRGQGVTFADWIFEKGWRVARDRAIVAGLAEAELFRLRTERIEESNDTKESDSWSVAALVETSK